ncbi:ABC transporter substrate-binding protein [Pelagibius sp.]|uniref:ABC transporter substrate-binding protein n=1 Tax=Pelagibius sp. TaxID=1931238 RepID=UPI002635E7C0|nr:ABC transporter substrate-binding protein [Pelagibius sp.]
MYLKAFGLAALGAAAMATAAALPASAADKQFVPGLMYRSGPYAPNGIPFANGFSDYFKMLNAKGGINGVQIEYEECDTAYNNDRGVECYERLKRPGAAAITPLSTGITYALIERATADKIPVLSMGYGRTAGSDGTVFPYVFTLPATYWSGADVIVNYIAQNEGGYDKLKGKKIALVYHDSAYGKEPIATLEALAAKHGFSFHPFPVAHPGLEQKATWLQIGRQVRPDWTAMWGWGVMNSTAIKEAAAVGYPMDRFIGIWWSGSEQDVTPAGRQAVGYKSLNFHGTGADFPAIQDILKLVHDAGNGTGPREQVGTVLYNRGVMNAAVISEAIRTAQGMHGEKALTGEQIRDGFEALNIDNARLEAIGLAGFMEAIQVSCADHEGTGRAFVQQWDGASWKPVSDWVEPNRAGLLRPMIEEAAAAYAAEKGITPRDCS